MILRRLTLSAALALGLGVGLELGLLVACGGGPHPELETLRETPSGPVIGFTGGYGSHAWLGIPYAEPPLGDLRWKAPRPARPWVEPREALAFGSACAQFASFVGGDLDSGGDAVIGEEDCLTLSIWAPVFAPSEVPAGDARLPVMFWIHGGGNVVGSSDFYDGGHLAASANVVVVAINYRLGPLGWFRHRSLRGRGTRAEDRSGNFGLLDQVRALEWVRDGIAAFGGDPDNVTIFGESAGGRDVLALMSSPQAEGLFQRAIAQSPGVYTPSAVEAEDWSDATPPGSRNSSNEIIAHLLIADGRAAEREDARRVLEAMSDDAVAEFLRATSAADLLAAYHRDDVEGLPDVPTVIGEGLVIPYGTLLERFAQRERYHAVPVMLGTNRDENKLFLMLDPERTRLRFGFIPDVIDPERYAVSAEYLSNAWKVMSVDEPAAVLRASQGPTVFVYRWDWDEMMRIPGLFDLPSSLGAAHGFEIPFVFGHWDLGPDGSFLFTPFNRHGREALSERMISYWTQFAKTGDPGRGRDGAQPEWTAWSDRPGAPRLMILDTPEGGGARMSDLHLTRAELLAAVESDPRLPTRADRCRIYGELTTIGHLIDADEYAAVADGACAGQPL